MSKKLLFIAALGVAGIATAQNAQAVRMSDNAVYLGKQNVVSTQNTAKAVIFTETFATAADQLNQFTSITGPASTSPVHWHYANGRATITTQGTTDLNSAAIFDEYLTLTNGITIPDDADYYRLEADLTLNSYWLFTGTSATSGDGNFKIEISNDDFATSTLLWWEDSQELLESTYTTDFATSSGFVTIRPRMVIPAEMRGVPVKFRFSLTGTKTASVYVDNISILTFNPNAVVVHEVFNGDIVESFEYRKIPLSQVEAPKVGVVGQNVGLVPANRDILFELLNGTNVVSSGTVAGHTFALGIKDTVWLQLDYTPTVVGDYTVRATLTDAAIETPEIGTKTFQVTENEWSHAPVNNDELVYGFDEDGEIGMGSRFLALNDATIYGLNAYMYNGTTVGQNLLINLHRSDANALATNGWVLDYQGEYIVKASDITMSVNNNSSYRKINIPFEYGVEVYEGELFMVEIRKQAGNDVLLLCTNSDSDLGTVIYGPFGQGQAINYFVGFDNSLGIEVDFLNDLSVGKVEGMENVTVYPNPSNGIVNISNTANEVLTVSVKNIAGQEVATTSVFGNGSIDLGNFGAGVYVFEISNGTSRSAKRVIVK